KGPVSDPFEAEWVLTPSQGMSVWIEQQLSTRLGVAANLRFVRPSQFLWQLAARLGDNLQVSPRFEKDCLRWHLLQVLPTLLHDRSFQPLLEYLERSSTGS